MISEPSLRVSACSHGSLDADQYRSALQAAIENQDVVRWHGQLVLGEEEYLRSAVVAEAESEYPRTSLIARLNQALQALGGDA